MAERTCVVVGAGVVGLAITRALARCAALEVICIDKHSRFGEETSSRNSEVLHQGIYYKKDSLKAKTCVRGARLMQKFIDLHNITVLPCGAYIVARDKGQLGELLHKAQTNGARNVDWAPSLPEGVPSEFSALWSPNTSIFDSHGVMEALRADAEGHGAMIATDNKVTEAASSGEPPFTLELNNGEDTMPCDILINAAGLHATHFSKLWLKESDTVHIPITRQAVFVRGNYFKLKSGVKFPFKSLVYPQPTATGLGTHCTLSLDGKALKFGPNGQWLPDDVDLDDFKTYQVDPKMAPEFYDSIRDYWPDLPDDSLEADYSGIRPKIDEGDFVIDDHGYTGKHLSLYGIESPGLTAALALAEEVLDKLGMKTEEPLPETVE
ncbi:L-2-hydroxyglutarate dehydrogenase, putative [Perkinsus marinus ATCC 50983]|uniref:L-2-hydroxyglutarate dehydrogenase, mitochondrial n=2 Tax=Perkinsus marinus (strain ATCC 50983 / TXsc) TaxID=423536 RepID=C5LFE2_PERM5|nr:L-2-hydroxyglutarate dehydrogenase, putative [Perkinsus marinus ATCC 50983]EER04574.1 L-2-hydroxyglutarate dehydrogenase, putative [Perkinsus marinus ATCC 50983]|eukprot:XP_002772758.1 L-2-hydroxyglutarate dehydrogenase, putative [Perkinsus marinus ATCC 50983]